jgi:MOSC domain-containing protein YiiM
MQSELFTEFKKEGADGKKYDMKPADLGENITTKGLDLLGMGVGTKLHFVNPGKDEREGHAVVCVTGLRNPCPQISKFQKGLQERCLVRGEGRKAGIMSVVEVGGVVMRGATIVVERPGKYIELPCV